MKCVIQRVSRCSVTVDEKIHSSIGAGLMVLVGIEDADTQEDIDFLAAKITSMRIMDDSDGVMNLSVKDTQGDVMIISQFTLQASTKKGNRPSYIKAAKGDVAVVIYEKFVEAVEKLIGKSVAKGSFGNHMDVSLINSGPVTIIIDSKNRV